MRHPPDASGAAVPRPRRALRKRRVQFLPVESAKFERCARCGEQAAQWHHWLSQQHLRLYVSRLPIGDQDARAMLRRLLHDRRNWTPFCFACHQQGEARAGSQPFSFREIPDHAVRFADEFGLSHLLHRQYETARPAG